MRSAALFILMVAILLPPNVTTAAGSESGTVAVWQGERFGVPIWVTVIARGHQISAETRSREPWWNWGNTSSDAYMFSIYRQKNVRLIIDFRTLSDGRPEASIYAYQNGRSTIDYELQGNDLTIKSYGGHPLIRMRPQDHTWFVDGETNYNLELEIDGRLPPGGGSHPITTDGIIDWILRVGSRQPGTPDWETQLLVNDPRPSWGYIRFAATQRMPDSPPYKVEPPFMPSFPHFNIGLGRRVPEIDGPWEHSDVDWYRENPRPIYLDLRDDQLELHSFTGFQLAGISSYSSTSLPPAVNFESPFNFYGFEPGGRVPNLVVRAGKSPENDPHQNQSLRGSMDRTSFRYSWKLSDGRKWRYSLDVAGSAPYTETIIVGEHKLLGIEAQKAPEWVMQREWPLVSFLEAVDGYSGSEGLYFYTAQAQENRPWLDGTSSTVPSHFSAPFLPADGTLKKGSDRSLPPNFRGEYSLEYLRIPKLYFSPIDQRVHLKYAMGGVWNLGNGQVLRMHNLDGDAYIDGWTREIPALPEPDPAEARPAHSEQQPEPPRALPGEVQEAFYALSGHLIHAGPQGVTICHANYSYEQFQLDPPTDKASWEAFRDRVAPFEQQGRDPWDLRGWLVAQPGTTILAVPGRIEGMRATRDGFRFELHADAPIEESTLPAARGLLAGAYVVSYDGTFRIEPLTPPAVSGTLRDLGATALVPSRLLVELENRGLQDLPAVTLELWADDQRSEPRLLASAPLSVLAGVPLTTTLEWVPLAAGEWRLVPRLRVDPETTLELQELRITVAPAPAAGPIAVAYVSQPAGLGPMPLLVLTSFAAAAFVVLRRLWATVAEEA